MDNANQLYNIVIEYYRTVKDIESGNPCKVVESGFKPMTLKEAEVCKSKMSDHKVCGYRRINQIIEAGKQ